MSRPRDTPRASNDSYYSDQSNAMPLHAIQEAAPSPAVGIAHSSRDERWLLAAPRASLAAKRASSPVSQTYAELIGRDQVAEDALKRRYQQRNSYSVPSNKSRAVYFDEPQHHVPRSLSTPRDPGQRGSPIIGELKTNVIIKDEFTLVTDLSYHLAARYSRPETCVMIKVDHSACLALGGAFDPCYILTISALPYQLSSASNRRNAVIIQAFMADILSVPADRGIIKFQAIDEGNLAMNGVTMLGETERNEKRLYEEDGTSLAVRRAISNANRKSLPPIKKGAVRLDSLSNGREYAGSPNGLHKNGLTATERADLERKRKSIPEEPEPDSPMAHDPMPNVYELPADGVGDTDAESSDPHEPPQNEVIEAAAKLPNGRPRTMGGPEPGYDEFRSYSPTDEEARRRAAARLSQPVMPTSKARIQAANRFSSGILPEQKSLLAQSMPPDVTIGPVRKQENEGSIQRTSSHATDGGRSTTTIVRHLPPASEAKPDPKIDARAAEKYARENNANMAKRRSTMTATPNLPIAATPPLPEAKTLSIREPKGILGKRKSFLSAFRRNNTASAH